MEPVKRTPLFALHQTLGARMTAFGGFAMPLNYRGIIPEHRAVRAAAGLFDLSHMGEFELTGPGALTLIERSFTNSAARLVDGQAQYTIMCAEDGGTLDDLIVYRLSEQRFMLCVNASNIASDFAWLEHLCSTLSSNLNFRDRSDATALVAIQGPRAAAMLGRCTQLPVAKLGRFRLAEGEVAGVRCLVARTGYTGEDGFELFCDGTDAAALYSALLASGAGEGLEPCGLGARDTLRMEAGLPLYGHELDRNTSPIEAGLSAFVKLGRDFVGAPVLAARVAAPPRRLIGLRTDDGRSIARQGHRLYRAGREVGAVTSGTFAPSFDRPLAMAYVADDGGRAAEDQVKVEDIKAEGKLEVEIRNRRVPATVIALPFYRRPPRLT